MKALITKVGRVFKTADGNTLIHGWQFDSAGLDITRAEMSSSVITTVSGWKTEELAAIGYVEELFGENMSKNIARVLARGAKP